MFLAEAILNDKIGKARYLITEAAILLSCSIFIFGKKINLQNAFRWKSIPISAYVPIILLSLSAAVLLDIFDRLIGFIMPIPPEQLKLLYDTVHIDSLKNCILIILGLGIVAPFAEESIFRGFIQQILEARRPPSNSVFWSSFIFALIHLNYWWFIQILIMSILLGYLSWRWNSIIPAILIHCFNNIWSVLVMQNNLLFIEKFYLWNGFVNPIVIILMITLFILSIIWCNRKWNILYL